MEEDLAKIIKRIKKELEVREEELKALKYLEKLRRKNEPCIVCREDRS